AFCTPTVLHFCAVLFVSTIQSAPWTAFSSVSIGVGSCGAAGVIYALIVVWRTRRQTRYKPVLEDWLWHAAFPLIAYSALLVAAILLTIHPAPSLFSVGAAVMLLLFIGIHNAWDAVTYIVIERGNPRRDRSLDQS